MKEDLSYDGATQRLLEAVPELDESYRRELARWGSPEGPGPHIVYEDMLDPFIEKALAVDDTGTLRRVFDFIERLSSSDDSQLHDLVAVAVCERLAEDPVAIARLRRYMGPKTRRILRKVLKR